MREVMLTTIDNPYDPFTNFEDWKTFDEFKGYYSCAYLARIALTSPEMSSADYEKEIERAIDEICNINVLGIYKKVIKQDT